MVLSLSMIAPAQAAQAIPEMKLRYAVEYAGSVVGHIEATLSHRDQGYELVSESQTDGSSALGLMATLLGKEKIVEKTQFQLIENRVVPMHYYEKRRGRKSYDKEINFNWANKKARYTDGEVISILPSETVEAGNFPLALLLQPATSLEGKVGHIFNGKGLRTYTYSDTKAETVKTPVGTFDAIRIDKSRQDKRGRTVQIWLWLVENQGVSIPVKIARIKHDSRTTMVLASANGIDLGKLN